MDYIELDCKIHPTEPFNEIMIALLAGIGYSMFEESEDGVKAYITVERFDADELLQLPISELSDEVKISWEYAKVENRNWNKEWEDNFKPVIIGKQIYVRAEYHESDPSFQFELVVQPRMAFGTGHHATTTLVLEEMLKMDLQGRRLLDMGCGTGILAIFAGKVGAIDIMAVDNDPNAIENTIHNLRMNEVGYAEVFLGDATTPDDARFDVILANINRNIILQDISLYSKNLLSGGLLVTSGYYHDDLELISEAAVKNGLTFIDSSVLNNWCRATFQKN